MDEDERREEDELRKVRVQEEEAEIHPRTVAHLCITHLLSFFTLSFRQDCPDGRGDDDEQEQECISVGQSREIKASPAPVILGSKKPVCAMRQ